MTDEITKLRHVDVHNHWLRQEVNRGRINVTYTKSQDMIEIKAAEEEYWGEDLGKEEMRLHRDQLPDPPSNWKEMMRHSFRLCQLEIPITRTFYGTRSRSLSHCVSLVLMASVH